MADPIFLQIIGYQSHLTSSEWHRNPGITFFLALGQLFNTGCTIVITNDIDRFVVRRNANSIRFSGIGDDSRNFTVWIDTIDGHHRLFNCFMPKILGITEIQASFEINGHIVWRIERSPSVVSCTT